MLPTDSRATHLGFEKLKQCSIITGYQTIPWGLQLLFQQVHSRREYFNMQYASMLMIKISIRKIHINEVLYQQKSSFH